MGQQSSSSSTTEIKNDAMDVDTDSPAPTSSADEVKKRLNQKPMVTWTWRDVELWLRYEAGLEDDVVAWIRPILEKFQFDGECLEVLGYKFLKQSAKALSSPPPGDIDEIHDKIRTARKVFLANIEAEREKAAAADAVAHAKSRRRHEPREVPHPSDPKEMVIFYHKESVNTETRGARTLDRNWANQPKGHRRWLGAPCFMLPTSNLNSPSETYFDIFSDRRPRENHQFSLQELSSFFYHALACTGMKNTYQILTAPRSSWSKRVNASSGGLHPVECYAILPPSVNAIVDSKATIDGAVYHYCPTLHGLEQTRIVPITSVDWREIWKYGERAFRYCQLDVGHAVGAIMISSLIHGWNLKPINSGPGEGLFPEGEPELPGVLICVSPSGESLEECGKRPFTKDLINLFCSFNVTGKPNVQSSQHNEWTLISDVYEATRNLGIENDALKISKETPDNYIDSSNFNTARTPAATNLVRVRRSAHDFSQLHGTGDNISFENFYGMLSQTVPSENSGYWLPLRPLAGNVHFVLYVQHVAGLEPGIYLLGRSREAFQLMEKKIKESLADKENITLNGPAEGFGALHWHPIPKPAAGAFGKLYLARVRTGENAKAVSEFAQLASCEQALALQCAFSIGMFVPEFDESVRNAPQHEYRLWHWESGAIGQLLYLEAQARGYRSCGMGCFTDTVTLRLLGQLGQSGASLYHFAIGIQHHPDDRYKPYDYEKSFGDVAMDELEESDRLSAKKHHAPKRKR